MRVVDLFYSFPLHYFSHVLARVFIIPSLNALCALSYRKAVIKIKILISSKTEKELICELLVLLLGIFLKELKIHVTQKFVYEFS